MATTEFHYFLLLPLEIRREIYTLATPPRIVHVKQCAEQDYNTFKEKLRTEPNYLKLNEALTHFSFNWRKQIPGRGRHPTLESYGFSSNKPPYQPWKISRTAPKICLYWLAEHPHIAWELARQGFLYSKAPIPALLHTWSESRHELIQKGYHLTFRTRSSGPRTWFNYDHDVLFISREDSGRSFHRVLSGCRWDLSQFDPGDMRKVRRVALEASAGTLYLAHPRFKKHRYTFLDQIAVLRLFQHIEELFLVEWTDEHMREICERQGRYSHQYFKKSQRYDIQGLWSYHDVDEVDELLQLCPPRGSWRCQVASIGPHGVLLEDRENRGKANYFEAIQTCLQEHLANRRNQSSTNLKADISTWWDIPMIRTVHILSNWGHEVLSQERLRFLRQVREHREAWLLQRERARNGEISPQTQEIDWEGDEQAQRDVPGDVVVSKRRRRWWIEEGIIPFLENPSMR